MRVDGVILPVTTPFDATTGEVAPVSFRQNLRRWLDAGVDGLVIAGSTGEAPLLDEDEIVRLAEWARDIVPPERTLIVGTGTESTRRTVRLSRAVAEVGADGVLVRPPSYYRKLMDTDTVRRHYEELAEASPIPIVLYHVPQFVPVEITAGLFAELGDHPNVVGIKDSTGDLKNLASLLDAAPDGCAVLVGAGDRLYAALELGAAGGVIAVGCLAPGLAVEVLARFREGDMEGSGRAQGRISRAHKRIVRGLGVPGVKHALDLLGYAGGPVRGPLRPLDEAGRTQVREELERAELLSDPAAHGSGADD